MTPRSDRVSRLPLRTRLVAGFSATMLLVLTGAGAFVYWRVQFALDRRLNTELVKTAEALRPLVAPSGSLSRSSPVVSGLDAWQVVDRDGNVLSFDPTIGPEPLLGPAAVTAALREPVYRDTGELLPITSRPLRLYADAVGAGGDGRAAVLVVATRRDQRDEALRELLLQLSAVGLGALVVTAFVGDRLARAALRPVERYRAQAVEIAGGANGIRLEVPAGRDDEITRLGHTLNDVLAALESAMESERRFINDASHEIRTPLTLLTSRVQLALRRPRTVAEHEAILDEVGTDVQRLADLAEQLLSVGTPQQPGGERTDLAELTLREAERRHTLSPPGSPYGAEGSLEVVACGPAMVTLSALQVGAVLGNLLDNAAAHGRPPVAVTVDQPTDVVRLTVGDRGDGMDAEMLAKAPLRFARSPQARSRRGSGLGLALVQATVGAVGGELRLCCRGTHQSFGSALPVVCSHGPQMTVTVLLPKSQHVGVAGGRDLDVPVWR